MACDIPEDKIAEYTKVFENADKSKDGAIQECELRECLRELQLNPSDAKLKKILNDFDKDKDGEINLQEFLELIKLVKEDIHKLETAFKKYDTDGSGFISKDELPKLLSGLGQSCTEEEVAEIMKKADTSGDDKIDYMEFLSFKSEFAG